MKKNTRYYVLATIAIVLLLIWGNLIAIIAVAVVAIVAWLFKVTKRLNTVATPAKTLDELTAEYGEPDTVVVIDAARANEAIGCIPVYRDKGFILVDGTQLSIENITGIAAKNSATPYTIGEYQIVITTNIKGQPSIRLNAGYDAEWAGSAAAELMEAIGFA